jgi:hypothetical protein
MIGWDELEEFGYGEMKQVVGWLGAWVGRVCLCAK